LTFIGSAILCEVMLSWDGIFLNGLKLDSV
jgi:hypothetical protein